LILPAAHGNFDPYRPTRIPMRTKNLYLMLACAALISACGGNAGQETLDGEETLVDDAQQVRIKKTRNIFYNIPSPMETAGLLRKAGAQYNGQMLNDVNNVNKYASASAQALNLGIYGADLSYTSVFNQTQESMLYTACAQNLAKKLNVSNAFGQETVSRMERNRNDRDSLLNIISETYWNVDAYLKEEGRDNISALMVAGGWVEGLYIATQVAKTNDSPDLRQRIAEQKLSLNDLVSLLGTYDGEDPALSTVKADMGSLAELFDKVNVGVAGDGGTSQEGGVTVIGGGGAKGTLTNEQLEAIREKAAVIRNNYIN
jgi:hypothetical protein